MQTDEQTADVNSEIVIGIRLGQIAQRCGTTIEAIRVMLVETGWPYGRDDKEIVVTEDVAKRLIERFKTVYVPMRRVYRKRSDKTSAA